MDLCNKLLFKCSLLIAISFALHIFTSPATTHNAMETTGHKTTRNNIKATTQQENNISNSYNNSSINANGNTSKTSSTISNRHNSRNSTVSDSTQHNSAVPSPRAEITTHQINVSATEANFATQSASALTRAVVSTTLRPPVSTVHGASMSTPAYFTTGTTIGNKTSNGTAGAGLNNSETSLTILFSVVLGVIFLIILGLSVYKMTRSRWAMYSHHPLHNEDTGGQFVVTDDTLVISGGLYDGPQIYNSTVTALNEDHMFTYTPTQFRLEFLHEDPATDHIHEATTFKTFNSTDQQPQ
ncbi:hypothetical protein AMELA_G00189140 [Ameiurus melas]|uniref:Uncharacterized protein n=1 Tax=Ameiurus melas TaxID=219545 RepID=A0A7J6AAS7_AMEME|nr:hypothetical protein AMELA_G00189140 [Ameiurus melas]